MDNQKYINFKWLDQETRILGMPLDESIPLIILCVGGLLLNQLFIGGLLGGGWVVFLKTMKRGNDAAWLISVIYWYAGIRVFFRKIPSAMFIHWIS